MNINLPFFGELNSDSLNDYYEVDINIEAETVQLDLNFDETSIKVDKLLILKSYLDDLQSIITIAEKEIINDFKNGEDVKEFLEFHMEELDQDDLDTVLKNANKSLSIEQQLLSSLKLRRIGFYPYDENEFAILDFILNEDVSQYILVVKMNDAKTVDHITMES